MNSCEPGEQAQEDPDLEHGVFMHYILEGLRGKADDNRNGKTSIFELYEYTERQTGKHVARKFNDSQHPRLRGELSGTWEFAMRGQRITNSLGMQLVRIEPGEFLMGSTTADIDDVLKFDSDFKKEYADNEQPQHRVRITRPFYLGIHEVTTSQFRGFVEGAGYQTEAERDGKGGYGWNASTEKFEWGPKYSWKNTGWPQTDEHPVVNVTWNDAARFCDWLTRQEGVEYRLPTEAEWEYACRAGATTIFANGNDPEGLARADNVSDRTAKAMFSNWRTISARDGYVFTAPVGRFRANEFGLYDMHGNVCEWCADWYDDIYYAHSRVDNPAGLDNGSRRVFRGGSWNSTAGDCRSAYRNWLWPDSRDNFLGFRVARAPGSKNQ